MLRYVSLLLGFAVVSGLAQPLQADTVAFTSTKDNSLFSTSTNSNGAGDAVFSGRTGASGGNAILRGLLAFDVAGNVPAGSTITSATLTLILMQSGPAGPQEHTLHRVLADWGEGTSSSFAGTGAPPTPGDATWQHTFWPDQFWANAGGDFDATVSASQTVGTAFGVAYDWGSNPQMVADVQDMLDNPGTDFGWMLRGNEIDLFTAKKLASKDHPVPDLRPVLTIEFEPPGPAVPTVSEWGLIIITLLLLTAGSLVFSRRPVASGGQS